MREEALDLCQQGDYNGDPVIEPEPSKGLETELKRLFVHCNSETAIAYIVVSCGLKRKSLFLKFRKFITGMRSWVAIHTVFIV